MEAHTSSAQQTAWRALEALGLSHAQAISEDALESQWVWLKRFLHEQRDTVFGREHDFGDIQSPTDYIARVPICNYSSMSSYIQRIACGEPNVLFKEWPVAFETTGGTTGSKLLPYTRESLLQFQRAMLPWLSEVIRTHAIDEGVCYWSLSPALQQRHTLPGGASIGVSDAEYFGDEAGHWLAQLAAVPHSVSKLHDFGDWQLATLYWLLVRNDLILVSVWSPTFLLALIDGITARAECLQQLFESGSAIGDVMLPPDSAAFTRLRQYRENHDTRLLWPRLRLISCWMDGASELYARRLEALFPQARFQAKGLIATEGVITVPDATGQPLLSKVGGFHEFIDQDGNHIFANKLREGKNYDVVMTTAGGLYRYQLGDRVRCDGDRGGWPILRFMGRSGISSDLVGEKLTEDFVSACMRQLGVLGILIPNIDNQTRYRLLLDQGEQDRDYELASRMDTLLSSNPQYRYARLK